MVTVGLGKPDPANPSMSGLADEAQGVQRIGRRLLGFALAVGLGAATALGILASLSDPALRPGRTVFHWIGLAGALGMVVAAGHLLLKRSGRYEERKERWTHWHIGIGGVAVFLAAVHATGHLRQFPALIVLASAGLWVTGIYGRWVAKEISGQTFARSAGFLCEPTGCQNPHLPELIAAKTVLLARMAPGADEGTFGLYPALCLRHPISAARFFWLSLVERRIVRASNAGTRPTIGWLQRYWRPAHVILAVLAVLGLLGHVVVTLFFAGYAAGGQPVYWWHVRK